MNRLRARVAALGCLAACSLPLASAVVAAAPAGAAPTHTVIRATEAESEHSTESESGEGHGEKVEKTPGGEKDNGLGIGIIAASIGFGLLAFPVLKLAGLKQT